MLLSNSKDFVTVSKKGIQVLALGNWDKRAILSENKSKIMVHSLDSYNFLKLGMENYLVFKCINEDQ